MSEHPSRIDLPRLGVSAALAEVLGHFHRTAPVFEVDRRGNRERLVLAVFGVELDSVELRMPVHQLNPAVHRDNRIDAARASGEGVYLLRKRVQIVLIRGHHKREKLLIGSLRHQGCAESLQQFRRLNAELACHDRECGLLLSRD